MVAKSVPASSCVFQNMVSVLFLCPDLFLKSRMRVLFTGGDKLHIRPPEHAPFQLVNIYGSPAYATKMMRSSETNFETIESIECLWEDFKVGKVWKKKQLQWCKVKLICCLTLFCKIHSSIFVSFGFFFASLKDRSIKVQQNAPWMWQCWALSLQTFTSFRARRICSFVLKFDAKLNRFMIPFMPWSWMVSA